MKLMPVFMEVIKGAAGNLGHHRMGICKICGMPTIFICIDKMKARENMFCLFCHSSSRKRHVAKMIIDVAFRNKIRHIRELPKTGRVKIYNADVFDSFYKVLRKYKHFVSSELIDNIPPGSQIGERAYCQNLEKLTFESESFDIVITEDIFEHIRNYENAFKEIYRVLKAGGYHIFTVPCDFSKKTVTRVDTSGDADTNLLPPEYHGGPRRGKILAYRTFGYDIFEDLKKIGFDTWVDSSKYVDQKFGIFDSYVFISKKSNPTA